MKIKESIQYWRYVSFSFRGRINRKCFWLHVFFTYPFIWFTGSLLYYEVYTTEDIAGVICMLFGLILCYTFLPVYIKRLHDTNRSGWNVFWGIIPIIGAIHVLIVCGCLKGTEGDNRYGAPTQKINWPNSKIIPYLLLWVSVGVTLVLTLGSDSDKEGLVTWLIVCLILVVNPIFLPKIWQFVLVRVREIAKAIRGTD